jgi:hypothetical protein
MNHCWHDLRNTFDGFYRRAIFAIGMGTSGRHMARSKNSSFRQPGAYLNLQALCQYAER